LIIYATEIAKGGETFVLKMPVIKLADLFETMKNMLAPRYGFKPDKIKTTILGIRPGEKLLEDLMNDFEMEHALETKEFFIIPSLFKKYKITDYLGAKKPTNIKLYFKNLKPISKDQVVTMLKKIY